MTHIFGTKINQPKETAVAIGSFDGLHLGHMKLLERAKELAQDYNLNSVVFSFFPHPLTILKGAKIEPILNPGEKLEILESFGIDVFVEYPFNKETAGMSPDDFVRRVLSEQLKCRHIVIGEGFSFGKGGKGNPQLLQNLGEKLDFKVHVIPHFKIHGQKVSSSDIRNLIKLGNYEEANLLLGRNLNFIES